MPVLIEHKMFQFVVSMQELSQLCHLLSVTLNMRLHLVWNYMSCCSITSSLVISVLLTSVLGHSGSNVVFTWTSGNQLCTDLLLLVLMLTTFP